MAFTLRFEGLAGTHRHGVAEELGAKVRGPSGRVGPALSGSCVWSAVGGVVGRDGLGPPHGPHERNAFG